MSDFKWTQKTSEAAISLASGRVIAEVASEIGISERTIYRWKLEPEFQAEVDRLSLMVDISNRAERLRIAMRVVRQKVNDSGVATEKDLLDWLKFAQGETDGVKLDLAALAEAASSLADK